MQPRAATEACRGCGGVQAWHMWGIGQSVTGMLSVVLNLSFGARKRQSLLCENRTRRLPAIPGFSLSFIEEGYRGEQNNTAQSVVYFGRSWFLPRLLRFPTSRFRRLSVSRSSKVRPFLFSAGNQALSAFPSSSSRQPVVTLRPTTNRTSAPPTAWTDHSSATSALLPTWGVY